MPDGQKLTVRQGGGASDPTVDYTSQLLVFEVSPEESTPEISGGTSLGGSQVQFVIDDDIAEIPKLDGSKSLAGHNQIIWSETVGGTEYVLFYARFAYKNIGPGDVEMYPARRFAVTADDINAEVRGLPLREAWSRPAESGRARVLAAISAFLNGSPRLTTVIATHLVAAGGETTMPAKVYPMGTMVEDILRDCAEVEGKIGFPVIHDSGGSHKCYLYCDELDYTTYVNPIVIRTDPPVPTDAERDSTSTPIVPASWEQGQATQENPQELTNVVIWRYGTGDSDAVLSEDTGNQADYDYWGKTVQDSLAASAAEAEDKAAGEVIISSREHLTHAPTIMLHRSQLPIRPIAGQAITFRSSAMMGGHYLDTDQTRRIVQSKAVPASGPVNAPEWYKFHLELDRPLRVLARPQAPVVAKPPSSGVTPTYLRGSSSAIQPILAFSETIAAGESIVVFASNAGGEPTVDSVIWKTPVPGGPDQAVPAVASSEVQYASSFYSGWMKAYFLQNPTAGAGEISLSGFPTQGRVGYAILSGIDAAPSLDSATGSSTSPSINASVAVGSLLLGFFTDLKHNPTSSIGTQGSNGDTLRWSGDTPQQDDRPFGALTTKAADATSETFSWSLPEIREWGYLVLEFGAEGATDTGAAVGTVGGTGSGTSSGTGEYIPRGSTLEHENITTGGPYHMAEDSTVVEVDTLTGTDVQTALENLAARIAALEP